MDVFPCWPAQEARLDVIQNDSDIRSEDSRPVDFVSCLEFRVWS